MKSKEHSSKPPLNGYVRAECIIGGYYLEEMDNYEGGVDTKLIIVMQDDLKGNIPNVVINMLSSKMLPKWVDCLFQAGRDKLKEANNA